MLYSNAFNMYHTAKMGRDTTYLLRYARPAKHFYSNVISKITRSRSQHSTFCIFPPPLTSPFAFLSYVVKNSRAQKLVHLCSGILQSSLCPDYSSMGIIVDRIGPVANVGGGVGGGACS